jgi:pSer/pThr/pTyr-binding forkhead associated (FHA) protein
MSKIIISDKDNNLEEMILTEGTVTIGRSKDNDILINDLSVSAHHAKLVTFFKPTYIQDLQSTNGTYVNSRRVMEHTLEQGDVITIGKQSIYFYKDDEFKTAIPQDHTIELSSRDISLILKKEDQQKKSD